MAKNLVNSNTIEVKENGTDISLDLTSRFYLDMIDQIKTEIYQRNAYSTSETRIGTWIDGKPLYRKVINFGSLPNNAAKTILHNINNIETFVTIRGIGRTSSNTAYPVPHVSNPNMFSGLSASIRANTTELTISTNADASAHTAYAVLEYTKTTD